MNLFTFFFRLFFSFLIVYFIAAYLNIGYCSIKYLRTLLRIFVTRLVPCAVPITLLSM